MSTLERIAKVSQYFRPGTPINSRDLFMGRQDQIRRIIEAICSPGQHVILFGERGVGKTSLTRILSDLLQSVDVRMLIPESINCDGTDTFSAIWHKVFRQIQLKSQTTTAGFQPQLLETNFSLDRLFTPDLVPDDVRLALSLLPIPAVIVIDEIDRLEDRAICGLLADTIKNLSDHASEASLVLVGVADSVDDLIREHYSIERSLEQIHMPRMAPEELFAVLDKGEEYTQIEVENDAKEFIVHLSAGLPHYTHTLGKHAFMHAAERNAQKVDMSDIRYAVHRAADTQGTTLAAYTRATSSPRPQTLYAGVLLACALADKDELGCFSAQSVREPLQRIMGHRYEIPAFSRHLDEFCSVNRGRILHKTGTKRQFRFRFINPLMQPYIIIHSLAKGLLREDMLSLTGLY